MWALTGGADWRTDTYTRRFDSGWPWPNGIRH